LKFQNIHWLQPPNFHGDQYKTQQAHVLHVTLLSFMVFLPIVQIGAWLGGRTPISVTFIIAILIIICIIGFIGLRKGYVAQVSVILISLTFILVTFAVAQLGTIRSPITTAYYSIIIISGLLFDLRGITIATLLSSLAIAGLILAQNAGMLPPADPSVTITQWITYTSLFITNGSLSVFVLRSTRRALMRAEEELAERKRTEEALKISEERLQQTNTQLQNALAEVKTLNGMLPICAHCKKIRDDKGYWNQLEAYIIQRTDATFTHGICPDCAKEFMSGARKG